MRFSMPNSRTRLRAAVCFGLIGTWTWTLSFVSPLDKHTKLTKFVAAMPLLIAQTAVAAPDAAAPAAPSAMPQQAGFEFPSWQSILFNGVLFFVATVCKDLISDYVKRMNDTNELRFSGIEKQLKSLTSTVGEVKALATVSLAILCVGIGMVPGPFLFQSLAATTTAR